MKKEKNKDSVQHANVLICTPGRSMEAEYVKSLLDTISYLTSNGITYAYLNAYSSVVNNARESTIVGDSFLDPFNNRPVRGNVTYDKIFWIDSDISWEIKDFIKIFNSEKDIISGIYFDGNMVPMFSVEEKNAEKEINRILKSKKDEEIFAAGFGFIAMKHGVFEKIPRPWFGPMFEKIVSEDGAKEIFVPYGEDYSWCKKAKDVGFKIYVDPTVRISHHKKVTVRLDVDQKYDVLAK